MKYIIKILILVGENAIKIFGFYDFGFRLIRICVFISEMDTKNGRRNGERRMAG